MVFLSDEFLQKYPNIKKFLESRQNDQEIVTEVSKSESYTEYRIHMLKFIYENNLIKGRDYLDYALELQKDFEKEKLKNGLPN